MRSISPAGLVSINASETAEVWLTMLVLSHPDFTQVIRLVNNTENVTHLSNVFQAFPFQATLPDEGEDTTGVVQWSASNVDRSIIEELRSVEGAISGSVFWIRAAAPDTVEIGPMDLEIRGFEYDVMSITGQMVIEPILDKAFGSLRMDTVNCPGLF